MNEYIKSYEYEKNVNPKLEGIPIIQKNINDCDFGITFIDFSKLFNVDYKSTSPNLLASFIKIKSEDKITIDIENNNFVNGTSHLFYILKGNCNIYLDNKKNSVKNGDILVTPCFQKLIIENEKNSEKNELQIYYINDSPLINYLGSKPIKNIFKTAYYPKEYLLENLTILSNPNNNRKGILLSNLDTEKIGINTISPTLWALYNELPPNTIQRPHKHNSVALDLCISCRDSENIYTLIGDELDENGEIVNPMKVNWKEGEMFITPPGLWHSHNNIGNSFAYILPIQDAGLLLYQRILGIVLH
jgi:gentisate 1,2-dioxygenase